MEHWSLSRHRCLYGSKDWPCQCLCGHAAKASCVLVTQYFLWFLKRYLQISQHSNKCVVLLYEESKELVIRGGLVVGNKIQGQRHCVQDRSFKTNQSFVSISLLKKCSQYKDYNLNYAKPFLPSPRLFRPQLAGTWKLSLWFSCPSDRSAEVGRWKKLIFWWNQAETKSSSICIQRCYWESILRFLARMTYLGLG